MFAEFGLVCMVMVRIHVDGRWSGADKKKQNINLLHVAKHSKWMEFPSQNTIQVTIFNVQ